MGHGITSSDRVAITGEQRAWHQLDEKLPEGLTAVEAFRSVGLTWNTTLRPLYFKDDTGAEHVLEDNVVQTRDDNLGELGIVSKDYTKLDNGDFARFFDSLVGADATLQVKSAGSFFGGRRVFCSAKLPRSIRVTSEDILDLFVVGSMGHGGFAGLNIYPSSVRPLCANTLRQSERDLGSGIRFNHLGDLAEKMKQAQLVLGLLDQSANVFEAKVKALAATQLSADQLRFFMEAAFTSAFGKMPDPKREEEAYGKMVAKREEVIATWMANLDNERNNLSSIRGTAWAAYNAVSEYHDHQRGGKVLTHEARVHSNLFGSSDVAKRGAFKAALAFAK